MYVLARRTPRGTRYYGLGQDGIAPGTMNCPGDPGCPGNPQSITDVLYGLPMTNPLSASTPGSVAQAALALATGGTTQPVAAPQTFTEWLNANGKLVAIGAAVFVGALVLTGGRRR